VLGKITKRSVAPHWEDRAPGEHPRWLTYLTLDEEIDPSDHALDASRLVLLADIAPYFAANLPHPDRQWTFGSPTTQLSASFHNHGLSSTHVLVDTCSPVCVDGAVSGTANLYAVSGAPLCIALQHGLVTEAAITG
jgi:acyl-CoA thioesterase